MCVTRHVLSRVNPTPGLLPNTLRSLTFDQIAADLERLIYGCELEWFTGGTVLSYNKVISVAYDKRNVNTDGGLSHE